MEIEKPSDVDKPYSLPNELNAPADLQKPDATSRSRSNSAPAVVDSAVVAKKDVVAKEAMNQLDQTHQTGRHRSLSASAKVSLLQGQGPVARTDRPVTADHPQATGQLTEQLEESASTSRRLEESTSKSELRKGEAVEREAQEEQATAATPLKTPESMSGWDEQMEWQREGEGLGKAQDRRWKDEAEPSPVAGAYVAETHAAPTHHLKAPQATPPGVLGAQDAHAQQPKLVKGMLFDPKTPKLSKSASMMGNMGLGQDIHLNREMRKKLDEKTSRNPKYNAIKRKFTEYEQALAKNKDVQQAATELLLAIKDYQIFTKENHLLKKKERRAKNIDFDELLKEMTDHIEKEPGIMARNLDKTLKCLENIELAKTNLKMNPRDDEKVHEHINILKQIFEYKKLTHQNLDTMKKESINFLKSYCSKPEYLKPKYKTILYTELRGSFTEILFNMIELPFSGQLEISKRELSDFMDENNLHTETNHFLCAIQDYIKDIQEGKGSREEIMVKIKNIYEIYIEKDGKYYVNIQADVKNNISKIIDNLKNQQLTKSEFNSLASNIFSQAQNEIKNLARRNVLEDLERKRPGTFALQAFRILDIMC